MSYTLNHISSWQTERNYTQLYPAIKGEIHISINENDLIECVVGFVEFKFTCGKR